MKEKKVAIIGKASNSQMLAPYDDESWEIWGLSNAYVDIPRWDVWFELHDWEFHRRVNPEHYAWLTKEHGKPIYAFQQQYHNAPSAVQFPLKQVLEMFGDLYNGNPEFKYWTNSPSYMMALAILQGATHIGMWGVDMAMNDEYASQRPSCELMIGVCLGRGIKVTIPAESSLCKCRRLYGYETHNDDGYVEVRTREGMVKQRLAKATFDSNQANFNRNLCMGALQEIGYIKQAGQEYNLEEREKILQANVQQQQQLFEESEKQKFIFQGALEDLSWVKTVFLT